MASRALRVLALADRLHPDADHEAVRKEEGLVFVGLVGMIDPPREEAKGQYAMPRGRNPPRHDHRRPSRHGNGDRP